jgi:hypothetical protein
MKKKFSLLIALSMLLLVAIPVQAAPSMDTSVFSVEENEYVTMVLEKFPANETYYVFMGEYGTYGMGGELVSKLTTNNGGTFLATFPIPDELYNEDRIAIRFQSASGKSVWWNWFFNDTSKGSYYYGGKFPYGPSDDDDDYDVDYNQLGNGFPTFVFTKVVRGQSVTVQTVNFPSDVRWAVYMKDGAMDDTNWYEVTGFNSDGSVQTLTLSIPADLQFVDKLAVKFYCLDYVLGTNDFITYNLVDNRDYP